METDASVESVWLTRLNEPANDGINLSTWVRISFMDLTGTVRASVIRLLWL